MELDPSRFDRGNFIYQEIPLEAVWYAMVLTLDTSVLSC